MRNSTFTTGQSVIADAAHTSGPQEGTYLGFRNGLHVVRHWNGTGHYEAHEVKPNGTMARSEFIETRGEW